MKILTLTILTLLLGCSKMTENKDDHVVKGDPWMVTIPTKDHLGNKVDIVIFPKPLASGGYVVNVHTEDDKNRLDGKCHGITIFRNEVLK